MAVREKVRQRRNPGEDKVLFQEKQRYLKHRIHYIVSLAVVMLFIILVLILQILFGNEQDDPLNAAQTRYLVTISIVIGVMTFVLPYILLRLRLVTIITESTLQVSYPPLIKKIKRIEQSQIIRYEKRKYRALIEYGGYRPRRRRNPYRRRKYGDAYIAYGKSGIQLYLSNHQKLLIGTQRSAAFIHALDKMMNPDEPKGPKEKIVQNKYNHG
jgi:uncharacterized membrane protein (DUF485 family)